MTCKVSLDIRFNQASNLAVQSIGNIMERLRIAVAVYRRPDGHKELNFWKWFGTGIMGTDLNREVF